jgi:hypothetical protein
VEIDATLAALVLIELDEVAVDLPIAFVAVTENV